VKKVKNVMTSGGGGFFGLTLYTCVLTFESVCSFAHLRHRRELSAVPTWMIIMHSNEIRLVFKTLGSSIRPATCNVCNVRVVS